MVRRIVGRSGTGGKTGLVDYFRISWGLFFPRKLLAPFAPLVQSAEWESPMGEPEASAPGEDHGRGRILRSLKLPARQKRAFLECGHELGGRRYVPRAGPGRLGGCSF